MASRKNLDHPSLQGFGARLSRLRAGRGQTYVTVALETGISLAYVWSLSKGLAMPSAATLEKLADYYGVTMDDLWRGEHR